MTADVEPDDTARRSGRPTVLIGLAALALFFAGAFWTTQIGSTAGDPQVRTAKLELRHESRDLAAQGPHVRIGPRAVHQTLYPFADLAPGEIAESYLPIPRFSSWEDFDGGPQVEYGKLPTGSVYDGFDCTGPVEFRSHEDYLLQFGYIEDEATADEIEIVCTVWTKREGS